MTDLIDTHCHLADSRIRDDLANVLKRARDAGVSCIITVGADESLDFDRLTVKIAETHDCIFAVVGVHPHYAKSWDHQTQQALEIIAKSSRKVVAIGETGLDFHYNHSAPDQQERALLGQLELADRLNLPAVFHCRLAERRLVEILKSDGVPKAGGVVHCFSGDIRAAEEFLSLGLYISFSGIVTFRNASNLREVASIIPGDRILVETDAPYLAPHPMRGKLNEPAFVRYTLEKLAEVRSQTPRALAEQIFVNAMTLFKLPLPSPDEPVQW